MMQSLILIQSDIVFWVSIVVDVQTVSIVIASAGVFAAAIYYIFQIRHQTRMRQTDLIMKLYSQFNSFEFQKVWYEILKREAKDYYDYEKKYLRRIHRNRHIL